MKSLEAFNMIIMNCNSANIVYYFQLEQVHKISMVSYALPQCSKPYTTECEWNGLRGNLMYHF